MGLGEAFRAQAGPPVQRVGLFAGPRCLTAALPRPTGEAGWGRAVGREHLDTWLLEQASYAGATVLQPWQVQRFVREGERFRIVAEESPGHQVHEFRSPVLIAAHGSWDAGTLPTQPPRSPPCPGDLLGFKAHFENSDLAS